MLAVIGSHALKRHFPGVPSLASRGLHDIDVICDSDELVPFLEKLNMPITGTEILDEGNKVIAHLMHKDRPFHVEAEIAWSGNLSDDLLTRIMCDDGTIHDADTKLSYASKDVLLALKLSHRYKKNSPHFRKTMTDIQLLRTAGAEVATPAFRKWLRKREKETYAYKHPSLKQSKTDFFAGDGINYVYDHDSIHVAVKNLDRPAYAYFKPEDEEVYTSKAMFFALPRVVQLCAGLEEATVLAIERSFVPHGDKPGWSSKWLSNLR